MRYAQLMNHAGATAIILALAAALPAAAQAAQDVGGASAAAAPTGQQASDDFSLTEIVVTARKREELLRDVPESISALSSAALTARGVTTIADLGRQTPGLQLNRRQDNTPNVTIRGVGSFGNVQGVGFFIDDVQNVTDQTMRLEDLDRVEILKGPQGTLYGGSAIGGAVKYITVKPTFDTYAKATIEAGEQSYRNVYAAVNTPLASDVLALRLSGYYTHDDGFVRDSNINTWSSEFKEYGARAQALLDIERFSALLAVRYRKYDGPGFAYVRQSNIKAPLYDSTLSFPSQADRETWAGSATLNYDFDKATLSSITSYTVQDYNYHFDADYMPANTQAVTISNPRKGKVLTQELRLTSDDSSKIDWIVGLYGQRLDNINSIPTPVALALRNGAIVINPYVSRDLEQNDVAGFGALTLHFGRLSAGGGLRVLHTSYKAHVLTVNGAPSNKHYSVSDSAVLPKFSVSYKTDKDTLLYVNAAQGYESGKVSLDANPALPFRAEKAWTLETGAKGRALDGKLDFEGALFYIDYSDKQAEDRFFDPGSGLIVEAIRNLGGSTSRGAEANVTLRPARGLSLYANGSYLRAKWDDGVIFRKGAADQQNIGGKDVPNSPRWSANFGADLRKPVADDLVVSLHADAAYTGRFRWRLQDVSQNYSSAFWVANLRAGVGAENGAWELAGRVENVFDEKYYSEFSPGAFINGAALASFNASGVCPVATPRCSNGAPAAGRRFVASLALRF